MFTLHAVELNGDRCARVLVAEGWERAGDVKEMTSSGMNSGITQNPLALGIGQLDLMDLAAAALDAGLTLDVPAEAHAPLASPQAQRAWLTKIRSALMASLREASAEGAPQGLESATGLCGRDFVSAEHIEAALKPVFDPKDRAAARLFGNLAEDVLESLLVPVLQETLFAFATQLVPGFGPTDSVAPASASPAAGAHAQTPRFQSFSRRLGGQAGKVAGLTKALAGSFGFDIKERVHSLIESVSGSLFQLALRGMQERLRTEEGRKLLLELRHRWVCTLLDAPLTEVVDDVWPDAAEALASGVLPALQTAIKAARERKLRVLAHLPEADRNLTLKELMVFFAGSDAKADAWLATWIRRSHAQDLEPQRP